jgi:DNA-directed RNA polymerase sigma subunit (sigma70/sigma32)
MDRRLRVCRALFRGRRRPQCDTARTTNSSGIGSPSALDRLPPNHAHIVRRYYLEDATLDDLASELGISKERVRQIREAAEKKLREDFVVLALWQSLLSRT